MADVSTAGMFHRAWLRFPKASLEDIVGPGAPLVLAPHPDDESLGCGGLIAASVAAGRSPVVAILTDGAGSHPRSLAFPPDRLRAVRANEARIAMQQLGLPEDRLVFLGQPDQAAPREGPVFGDMANRLAALVADAGCSAILAPWQGDPHCDHEAASVLAAAVAACTGVRHVAYPVWGWMLPADASVHGVPGQGWRLDIGPFLSVKKGAIAAHRSQCGGLISDDPGGFQLPADLLSVFTAAFETFFPA